MEGGERMIELILRVLILAQTIMWLIALSVGDEELGRDILLTAIFSTAVLAITILDKRRD